MEDNLINQLNLSYNKVFKVLKNKNNFKNQNNNSNCIDKIRMINCKINDLNNDLENIYINILENKMDINEKEGNEIKIEKNYQNTIRKLLPAIILQSLIEKNNNN